MWPLRAGVELTKLSGGHLRGESPTAVARRPGAKLAFDYGEAITQPVDPVQQR
jgi:hypothetical protein